MKHNVTPLKDENELLDFIEIMFGNCLLEKTLECYPTWPNPTSSENHLGLLPRPTDDNETCTVCFSNCRSPSNNGSSSSNSTPNGPYIDKLPVVNLDKLGTHDGSRTDYISIIQNNEQRMISSFLKFKGTNDDVEYEALMLNTPRTNTTNEQSNLGTYHDPKMAYLGTSYTLQQQQIVDRLIEQYRDGPARVDEDMSTHYT